MSDIAILATSVKASLQELAKQAAALGIGLQNAAPVEKSGVQNNSVSYLLTISETLAKTAKECEKLISVSEDPALKQD